MSSGILIFYNTYSKAYGSKQIKNIKSAEKLPTTPYNKLCDKCTEIIEKLNDKEQTFDVQASTLRKRIHENCLNCDFMKVLVFWYFNLSSGSSLKFIIASSLNKLDENSTLIRIFDDYIKCSIASGNPLSTLTEIFQRCFENCNLGLAAIQINIKQLYKIFTQDLQNGCDPATIRALLSLESQGKCPNEDLIQAVCNQFKQNSISSEARNNLALIWTHEIVHFHADFIEKFVDYNLDGYVQESFSVSTLYPIANFII